MNIYYLCPQFIILPNEIQNHIYSYLPKKTICRDIYQRYRELLHEPAEIFYNITYSFVHHNTYNIQELPYSIKHWVLSNYPGTTKIHVKMCEFMSWGPLISSTGKKMVRWIISNSNVGIGGGVGVSDEPTWTDIIYTKYLR
jgi:hypothetical protein